MADSISKGPLRGSARSHYWGAECKDCLAERRTHVAVAPATDAKSPRNRQKPKAESTSEFEYSGSWANRAFELGHSRSDRCDRHRRSHRAMIRALSVPYVDLNVIGEVRDRENPTGPLGGLGPLPRPHKQKEALVNLETFGFGMSDADILMLLEGMKERRVAVVEAGTGTGKSTFMPFRLMSPPDGAAWRPTDTGPIVVTEPRRQAATGLAGFVGEALVFGHDSRKCRKHTGPGFPVGYQVSGDRKWDSACDLIYVTDGTMINWVRDGSLARIGMVIVDEAHERSANIDIILAQLRQKIDEYKHLRVVITSATIDREFFVDYFGGPAKVFQHTIPEKKSFGYGVPLFVGLDVDAVVIREGITLPTEPKPIKFSGWSGFGPTHPGYPVDDLARETAKYAALRSGKEIPKDRWIRQMPRALADQVVAIAEGTEFGDILGFLPTSATISEAIGHIRRSLKNVSQFDIYPLLSSTDPVITSAAVTARVRGERRKIVISSNLAETSLTVSGVRYVVDSGLICQSEWNADIASGGLPKVPHSQSGLRQRWGRVGRDAPGWVFPLYTAEQFLSLARDTPPESTRSNLEEFCTRLLSTGLNPDTAVLPGNFFSENYRPDHFAQEASKTFTKELKRASLMLRTGGLVDADGDLTDLGREIERYSGSASEALAIALGDRLACLHEVALGIAVVARGNMYGGKNSILKADFDWPPEWRLRADACHRALSANCEDDLDLALRVATLYQSAGDGALWCRTWWVNQAALDAALTEVASIIGSLSAAMKQEVARPFSRGLLPRARAALTQAFQAQTYRAAENRTLVSRSDGTPAVGPARALVPPQGLVLALNRVELATGPDQAERRINHFVKADESLLDPGALPGAASLDDFGLLLRLTRGGRELGYQKTVENDAFKAARLAFPIGCVIRFAISTDHDGAGTVVKLVKVRDPFLAPMKFSSGELADEDSGYDPDWDYQLDGEPRHADDSYADQPLNPRRVEANDEADGKYERFPNVSRQAAEALPLKLSARPLFGPEKLDRDIPHLVSDYALEGDRVVVLLEPFIGDRANMDPARHESARCFDVVEVEFLDKTEDTAWEFLRLRATHNQERFDVPSNRLYGLDRYADTSNDEIRQYVRFEAVVLATAGGRRTITLRSFMRTQLDKGGTLRPVSAGSVNKLHSAVIASEPNNYGTQEAELETRFQPGSIAQRVQIRTRWLESKGIPLTVGQRIQVGFEGAPNPDLCSLPSSKELDALTERSDGKLAIKGRRVVALAPIDLQLARRILALDASEEWAVRVSEFFEASQTAVVGLVLPPVYETTLSVSGLMAGLLDKIQREFESRHGVRIQLRSSNELEISGSDVDVVETTKGSLLILNSCSYVALRLPEGTVGRVIGTGGQTIRSYQQIPGIEWLWVDSNIVHIFGRSSATVAGLLSLIKQSVESAAGLVTVPREQIGAFIGPKGAHVMNASSLSKTRNFRTGIDGQWRVEGSSIAALELFAAIARQYSKDLTLQIISRTEVELLAEQTVRAPTSDRAATISTVVGHASPPVKGEQHSAGGANTVPRAQVDDKAKSATRVTKIEPAPAPISQRQGPSTATPEPTSVRHSASALRPRPPPVLPQAIPVAMKSVFVGQEELSKLSIRPVSFMSAVFGGSPKPTQLEVLMARYGVKIVPKLDSPGYVSITGENNQSVEQAGAALMALIRR